jgi:hypothetical protein
LGVEERRTGQFYSGENKPAKSVVHLEPQNPLYWREATMGVTKIMVIRHAEKPATPPTASDPGLNPDGSVPPDLGPKLLTARGWARAGALVDLFAPPSGPRVPLATPQLLFASNPDSKPDDDDDTGDEGPSQRPFETLSLLAVKLGLPINTGFRKKHYNKMVEAGLDSDGVLLIAWQHEDIAMTTKDGAPGISAEILSRTGTQGTFTVPSTWPMDAFGMARYDLVSVFDRPSGTGAITGFTLVPQHLLPGGAP